MIRVTVCCACIAAMCVVLFPDSVYGQQRPRTRQTTQELTDPAATATILALLARHAEDVSDKTQLDRQVDEALKSLPDSRKVAAEIVAKFRKLPQADRKRLFGARAAISADVVTPEKFMDASRRIVGKRSSEPALLRKDPTESPIDVRQRPRKHRESESGENESVLRLDASRGYEFRLASMLRPDQLEYTGLYCREEANVDQGTASDEYYIVTSVIAGDGVNRTLRTVKHPADRDYYTSVDTGDRRNGPVAECWSGPAANLALVVIVLEQDADDDADSPTRYRRWIDALARLALLVDALGGESVTTAAVPMIRDMINPIEDLPETDDYIQGRTVVLNDDEVSDFADAEEQLARQTPYDFLTDHRGDGARIRIYFRITP